MIENVPRILPEQMAAVLKKDSWPIPPLFRWLQKTGNIVDHEMARVFNCGIGMVIVLAPEFVAKATQILQDLGETVWQIGVIEPREAHPATRIVQ